MNKKGFTLIELLAVIAILGVLTVITVPVVAGIIRKTGENTLEVSAANLLEASKSYFTDAGSEEAPFYLWETAKVTVSTLIEYGLVDPIIEGTSGKECSRTDSYVEIGKNGNSYIYNVIISCDNTSYKIEADQYAMDEYKLKYATKLYIKANDSYPSDGTSTDVAYSDLKTGGYIETIYDPTSGVECSTGSYGTITNTSGVYTYAATLVCPTYTE